MPTQITFDFGTNHVAANDPLYSNQLFKQVQRDYGYYKTLTAKRQRRLLMERARKRCEKCHSTVNLEIDHIIPIAAGGDQYCLANQQVLCRLCHQLKTSMDFQRYGWRAK